MKKTKLVRDCRKWKRMAGDTDIEKKVNSYLTERFVVGKMVPVDECLKEAQHIVDMVVREIALSLSSHKEEKENG